eukprot:6179388-Pyramimonas_sp.AAC.2
MAMRTDVTERHCMAMRTDVTGDGKVRMMYGGLFRESDDRRVLRRRMRSQERNRHAVRVHMSDQ